MNSDSDREKRMKTQYENVCRAIDEGFEQLRLTEDEESEARLQMAIIFERDLFRITKGLAVIASLLPMRNKDIAFFKKRGVSEDQAEDLTQSIGLKVIEKLLSASPCGNLGAWRSKLRENILNDFGREQQSEKQHLDQQQNPEFLASKCNPLQEQEVMEELTHRLSHLEREIIDRRLWGENWDEIATVIGMPISQVMQIARDSFSKRKSSPLRRDDSKCRN